jgi:pyruvate dehydrogenase E2 component (dihydrolipoamide acetyltransferase)
MDFLVPKLSATMESAKVLRWLKQVGDKVAMGEPLVELETDKAAMEVESPVDATLIAVLAEEEAELPVGGVLARLQIEGEAASAIATKPAPASIAAAPTRAANPLVASATSLAASAPPLRIMASPLAKRLAQTNGIDLAGLAGAGQRLRKRDVLAAVDARGAKGNGDGFEPLSAMRSQIAEAVALSRRTIPSFALDRWVETTAVDAERALLGTEIERTGGVTPTFTDFLLLTLAESFSTHPRLLDRWREEDGRAGRVRASSIDIGLIVALPEGMMIPVLRDLAGKTLREIARARHAAVQRARQGRLLQADYAPVSFSLSNIGKGGADRFEAIIHPGQSGILAVGRRHERVVSRSGAIALASGVYLTLCVDHRLIDGLHGAQVLEAVAERFERTPWSI